MSGMLSNNQVVTTLLGTDVTVTITGGNVYIDNAMVTVADIVADNGVVHVIDAVLLPPLTTSSWDCINGACIDPQTGLGQYTLLSACQANCVAVTPFFTNDFSDLADWTTYDAIWNGGYKIG